MRKLYIYISLIVISILLFIAIVVMTMYFVNMNEEIRSQAQIINELEQNRIVENLINSNVEIVTTSVEEEEKTSPNCIFEFKTYYNKCQHTVIEKEKISDTMVNKTLEDIEGIYKTWDIIKFSRMEVVFAKEVSLRCHEHYLVKDFNGYITIYSLDENDKETIFSTTEITTNYLPEEDKKKLKEGIKIDTDEKLNQFLEDYE